jgi:hypothetical protein
MDADAIKVLSDPIQSAFIEWPMSTPRAHASSIDGDGGERGSHANQISPTGFTLEKEVGSGNWAQQRCSI